MTKDKTLFLPDVPFGQQTIHDTGVKDKLRIRLYCLIETKSKKNFFVQLVELIIHLKAIDYSGCAVSILIIFFGGVLCQDAR